MRQKKRLAIILMTMVLLLGGIMCVSGNQVQATDLPAKAENKASTDLPTDGLVFITLAENTNYRWNANDLAVKSNVIHLDNVGGDNCNFRLKRVEGTDYYGIKHIKDGGTDLYVDIENKSKDPDKVLHLWDKSDDDMKKNNHRQFAFYKADKDIYGNQMYYIKNKNSGLWVGVENNSIQQHKKIIQTTADKAKKWYITPAVAPVQTNNQDNFWQEKDNSLYCEIQPEGTMYNLDIRNSTGAVQRLGEKLNYYAVGTNAKWALKWVEKYQAYQIGSVKVILQSMETGFVWDVDGENGTAGTSVHLWAGQDFDDNYNTSQLWRFISVGDDLYKIQNARTGLYLGCKDNSGDSDDMGQVVLENWNQALVFRISMLSTKKNDLNTKSQSKKSEGANWMAKVPDEALLSTVNLPGSHDAGTASIVGDTSISTNDLSLTKCQGFYYEEQLQVGVRSFDIRCNAKKSASAGAKAEDVMIIHGNDFWQCSDRWGNDLTLANIFQESRDFLDNHPSETIVLLLKPDDGDKDGLVRAISKEIAANKTYYWDGEGIPSMGEARGKIVLLHRFTIDTSVYDPLAEDGIAYSYYGPDLTNWDKNPYKDQYKALKIYDKDNVQVWAQDAYNTVADNKIDYIEGTLKQTTGGNEIPSNAWVFNYTSESRGLPLHSTRKINQWIYQKNNYINQNGFLGMVMFNYVDGAMSRLIYETNYKATFMEMKVDFPKEVSLTYGESLEEAVLSNYDTKQTGTFTFADPYYVPTMEDVSNGKEFEIIYTPKNSNFKPVTGKVKITNMKVPIRIENQRIVYGDALPTFTYVHSNGAEITPAEKDIFDLNITYTSYKYANQSGYTMYSTSGHLKADEYTLYGSVINISSTNSALFDFIITEGTLVVEKKPVEIAWSDVSNLVYGQINETTNDTDQWIANGGANVTATVSNLEEKKDGNGSKIQDICMVEVADDDDGSRASIIDDSDNVRIFYAEAVNLTGADAENYRFEVELPAKPYSLSAVEVCDNPRIQPFVVRRNTDSYILPQAMWITYGEDLTNVKFLAGSYDSQKGMFKICDVDGNDLSSDVLSVVNKAGIYPEGYYVKYDASNDSTLDSKASPTPLLVKRKVVIVKAEDKMKTYGEDKPTYKYNVLQATPLVSGDTTDGLITLTAIQSDPSNSGNTISGDHTNSPVGTYDIVKKEDGTNNGNYRVILIKGTLNIQPKTIGIEWTGDNTKVYDGQPIGLSAVATGLLEGDVCNLTVTGGDKIDAGTYYARVTALDNSNYSLPKIEVSKAKAAGINVNVHNRIVSYTIEKANPVLTPSGTAVSASYTIQMSYGALLDSAIDTITKHVTTSVPGTFSFVDKEVEIKANGTYKVIFTPDDTKNYNGSEFEVNVQVIMPDPEVTTEATTEETTEETKVTSPPTGDAGIPVFYGAAFVATMMTGAVMIRKRRKNLS